ncbi:hypothetical protein [Moritella sp. F3]|uniref:hypothetical protein n=1 Tax=Moritella sp. F3 TaxID=2718882 RepID=UPI0018E14CF3|nr:hypothetical protein [Moritella sp. F3]GIC77033.1 hypothetical protein FMO001_17600 [Moritella sp. F1]GIC82152.1 hypothetical protein FMO003_24330 [Moritella sp. F3]
MKSSFPLAVYPSQLNAFKEKSDQLAKAIADALSQKKLSSFKRNDYLSIGIGYKSHSELTDSAKFRNQADENDFLIIYNKDVTDSIIAVFTAKIEGLSVKLCRDIVINLSKLEQKAFLQAGIDESVNSMHDAIFDDELIEDLYETTEDEREQIVKSFIDKMPLQLEGVELSPKEASRCHLLPLLDMNYSYLFALGGMESKNRDAAKGRNIPFTNKHGVYTTTSNFISPKLKLFGPKFDSDEIVLASDILAIKTLRFDRADYNLTDNKINDICNKMIFFKAEVNSPTIVHRFTLFNELRFDDKYIEVVYSDKLINHINQH